MNRHTINIENLDFYPQAAAQFIAAMQGRRIFAFYGSMGAGKTTFIKALCEAMGVEDAINSPTFAIVNEYESAAGDTIYHFDFYRIKSIAEVYNMGYEEYLYGNAYCFIEWPELIEELLPEETVKVTIEESTDGHRTITME
ncbi:MAG: tRNA (adenosine(37)-N6)-threonylcarbamoyltransferase complex ATPase subunit type 1 TsaE [Bacteroidaceae bacterium]|nr:tRNA (adenosine(37)-N6)-threonylcarbamoyltransferase complex ATPase subunit type 1 TsaE [Bacteroidaceae bacterium]